MIFWSKLLKFLCAIFTPKDIKNRMLSLNPFANFNFLCFASSNFLKSSFVIPVVLQIVVISQHLLLTGNCKFLVANPFPQKRDKKRGRVKHTKNRKPEVKFLKVLHFMSFTFSQSSFVLTTLFLRLEDSTEPLASKSFWKYIPVFYFIHSPLDWFQNIDMYKKILLNLCR